MRFWSQCLLLVFISIAISKAEYRVKKDISLIKEIILTKIFGNPNESKYRPIFIQDNFYKNPEGLLTTGKEEIKIKIPKEDEEPYKPEYIYKQIRNDGSAIVYTLNDKDEVIVSDTRNQQNPVDSSEYARNKPAFSSFQARLKPSKQCKADNPYVSLNPLRQIMYGIPQTAPKFPDYSYKLIHRDGSITTYLGTGEVQEQQLRDPARENIAINRYIQNPQPYVLNRIQNTAGAPFIPNRSNLLFTEEIEPIEVIGTNQLPPYQLPLNEPLPNIVPNEIVYLPQASYNIPVTMKPLRIEYDQMDTEQARQEVEDVDVSTASTHTLNLAENSSDTVEGISDLVSKVADSKIEYIVTTVKTTASPNDNSTLTKLSLPTTSSEKEKLEMTTIQISTDNDEDDSEDVNSLKINGNSLGTSRGDVPSSPK